MSIPSALISRFAELKPFVEAVSDKVKPSVRTYCDAHGYASAFRFKSIESVAEKIETGRFRSIPDIDDLFACTIVVPTMLDERSVIDFCATAFHLRELRVRAETEKPPQVFRFDSTRAICSLRPTQGEEPSPIHQILFEIQIRTALEHAWSAATHSKVYKTDIIDWRRIRLASQIKASVEQLDALLVQFDSVSKAMDRCPDSDLAKRQRVARVFSALFSSGLLPAESRPTDFSRFCDNFVALIRSSKKRLRLNESLSAVIDFCKQSGLNKIPRSVSLLQLCIGVLSDQNLIGPLQRYFCHITPELVSLFPKCRALTPQFDYV